MMNKYNTFWPRFFALIIDGFVLDILQGIFKIIHVHDVKVLSTIQMVFISNIPYLYVVFMIGEYGQTLGKMAMKIKVVDNTTEENIGYSQAFMREAVPIFLVNMTLMIRIILFSDIDSQTIDRSTFENIILFLPAGMMAIWALLEIITMMTDDKNRALHDKIADTVVVRISDR